MVHGNGDLTASSLAGHPTSHYKPYRYKTIIDDVSGTEVAAKTGGSCASTASLTIAIPSRTDVVISEVTCIQKGSASPDGVPLPWVQVWTTVSWRPASGSSSISGFLNNLNPHVQMQLNNVTKHEAHCEFADNMTDSDGSGSRACSYTLYNPPAGTWTADGNGRQRQVVLTPVTTALGVTPMIYTNQAEYRTCLSTTGLNSYPLIVADYTNNPPVLQLDLLAVQRECDPQRYSREGRRGRSGTAPSPGWTCSPTTVIPTVHNRLARPGGPGRPPALGSRVPVGGRLWHRREAPPARHADESDHLGGGTSS